MSLSDKEVTLDRILVLPETPPSESGGILLTTVRKVLPTSGIAIAVGPGRITREKVLIPMQVAIGDKVVFQAGIGKTVRLEGTDYLMIHEADVLAVITEEEK